MSQIKHDTFILDKPQLIKSCLFGFLAYLYLLTTHKTFSSIRTLSQMNLEKMLLVYTHLSKPNSLLIRIHF